MKTIAKLSTFLFFALFVLGCSKDSSIDSNNNVRITKDGSTLFVEEAENHNVGLDYIYNCLVSAQSDSSLVLDTNNYDNLILFVKIRTHNFLMSLENTFIQNNQSIVEGWADYSFTWIVKGTNDYLLYDSIVADSLTNRQKDLLNELSNAVYDISIGYDSTLAVFEHIRQVSNATCSERELYAMLAAIEIGESSLYYWNAHYDEWNNIYPTRLKSWFNWKELLGQDIKGAVTGAVTGLITNGPSGAGVGALAGGLGASAGSAAIQLYHHWVD